MTHKANSYCTIKTRERSELVIKASRFIASIAPAASKEEALEYLQDIRKEFYDATHNCFAYRLGAEGLNFRFSDDGEPSGTAGRPILFALQKARISDVILVVTRYYGGTKLGVGPLARAYSEAATQALHLCRQELVVQTTSLRVFCVYDDIAVVKRLLHHYAERYDEHYADAVEFVAVLPQTTVETFIRELTDATSARAGVVVTEKS